MKRRGTTELFGFDQVDSLMRYEVEDVEYIVMSRKPKIEEKIIIWFVPILDVIPFPSSSQGYLLEDTIVRVSATAGLWQRKL